jgi:SAM-dependent methyltransferase
MSGEDLYPARIAQIYDLLYPDFFNDIATFCDFLGSRSAGTRVLEYGVGTGRLALPLIEKGFDVTGLDVSNEMLSRLKGKDADGRVKTIEQDFITEPVEGTYDAVLLMINTLFVAKTLDEQIAVFRNAATNLTDDGLFLVETFNPNHYHGLRQPEVQMRQLSASATQVEQYVVEPSQQMLIAQNLVFQDGDQFTYTHVLRYLFPFEMDAVARNAGLVLNERWADWGSTPFNPDSPRCLSLYRKGSRS